MTLATRTEQDWSVTDMPKFDFFRGFPTDGLLARKEVLHAANNLLAPETRAVDSSDDDRHPLTYGTEIGSYQVRKIVYEWSLDISNVNEEHSSITPDPEYICLSNGASFGAFNALLSATHAASGYTRRAFIVSPTYYCIHDIFGDAGFHKKVTGIAETANGLDLDNLEQKLQQYEAVDGPTVDLETEIGAVRASRKCYKYVLYLIPTFSNPRGYVVTVEERMHLLKIARKYDMLIICDDVYDSLNLVNRKLPSKLVWLDRQTLPEGEQYGNVISNGTFSKIAGPGLRFGWQETATPKLAKQLSLGGLIQSSGSPSQLTSYIVAEMIQNGSMNRALKRMVSTLANRSRQLKQALQNHMPKDTSIEGGDGGYFYWVTLPRKYGPYGERIVAEATKAGIVLAPGKNYTVEGDNRDFTATYRFCYGYLTDEVSVKGIEVLGKILKECMLEK